MQRKPVLQLALAGSLCAVALFASDFWKTKDSKEWSNEEVAKMLTDSPWSKQITVNSGQPAQRRSMGRRGGGMGGGGGYPGGGGGYPGGGGGGYPGGGSSGGGGGGYGGSSSQQIVLRWESAQPVQEALLRQRPHSDDQSKDDAKSTADTNQKYYVVAMLGFRMPSRRNDSDSSDNESDKQRADDLRSQYLDAAQLIPKSKIAISAEDVTFEGRNGSTAIRFLFPKTFPISKDEKEITFQFQSRGVKFDHKFKLSDMMFQEKLAL
jgi:hypothetical protein